MQRNRKKIVIIGGGLAGLSAGVFGQINGFETEIYEAHKLPGGVCTSWQRGDYLIDGCIHFLMGCGPSDFLKKLYQEVGALDNLTLRQMNYYGKIRVGSGEKNRSIVFTNLRLNWISKMIQLFPKDKELIQEINRAVMSFEESVADWSTPYELMSFIQKIKFFWSTKKELKYFRKYKLSVEEFSKRANDPDLEKILKNIFLPEMPTVFLFMLLGQLSSGRLAFVEEGSLAFAKAIEKKYCALGGVINYKSEVKKIVVQNNQNDKAEAVGIELVDGKFISADIVVGAGDLYSTLNVLLEGKFTPSEWATRFEKWPTFSPILLASFGVNRTFFGEPTTQTTLLSKPIQIGSHKVDHITVKIFSDHPAYAPRGKTVLQVILSTDYDFWDQLKKSSDGHYKNEKEKVLHDLKQWLNVGYPGFSEEVEMEDLATPLTFVRYTKNHLGAWEGWMMTPENFGLTIKKTLPGLLNFYLAGQWVEPGGGVPTAIISGRSAIQKICHDQKLKFRQ